MSELKKSKSDEIHQPLAELPEATGNPIADKANMWLYVASLAAAKEAQKIAIRRVEDEASMTGSRLQSVDEIGQPDFSEDDTALLTKIVASIDKPDTQIMLASLYDLREAIIEDQGGDIIGQQMLTMRVILNNPDILLLM